MGNCQTCIPEMLKQKSSFDEIFTCPITGTIMKDPVNLPCGHTFEREAILQSLRNKKECPLDRKNYDETKISTNFVVKDAIKLYLQKEKKMNQKMKNVSKPKQNRIWGAEKKEINDLKQQLEGLKKQNTQLLKIVQQLKQQSNQQKLQTIPLNPNPPPQPPAYQPPIYQAPAYQTTVYQPPVYQPPMYQPYCQPPPPNYCRPPFPFVPPPIPCHCCSSYNNREVAQIQRSIADIQNRLRNI